MRNSLRTYVAGLLVFMMSINPAVACRFCGGDWGGYSSYGPVYYGPVAYDGGCDNCGGCYDCSYEVVVDECSGCQSCGECSSCGDSVVFEGESMESIHESMPTPALEPAQPMNPQPATPAPPQQPAHAERPVESAPAPQLPTTPPQAEPPLPANENAPPTPPPADLFNSAPAAEKAAPPAAAPAKPAESNDIFGTPAEKPAEAPAATPPSATPPAATPPAATPPAATNDLFDTKPVQTPPATPPAPAPVDKPAEKPADKPAGDEKKKDATDIFGTAPSVLQKAGGLASNEMREWVDNTGNYSCRGRLVRFLDGQVRLVKDNGHTTTVSLARLSAHDLEFVERQASAQQTGIFQTAQSLSVMPWMAN